jgi:hypothetical protein
LHAGHLQSPKNDSVAGRKVIPFTHFVYKPHWFVLSQTEGTEYVPEAVPEWNEETALTRLNVQRVAFESLDGNIQGYAKKGRKIAVNPVAALPHKTLFHELAHLVLNHTEETAFVESENVREVEAEAVALLCCESLSLPGTDYSRGYIQSWSKGQPISERSAQRIFHAADQILRAGRLAKT